MLVKQDNSFFVPYGLKHNKIYQGHVFSLKKNDVVLNFLESSLLFTFSSFYFENLLETRFWLYNSFSNLQSKRFMLCLKKLPNSKIFEMEARRLEKDKNNSYLLFYNLRKFVVANFSRKFFFKSRILMLGKRGYVLSFLGKNVLLKKKNFYRFFRKKFSYAYWFFFNLQFIGFLNLFTLFRWSTYSTVPHYSFLKQKNSKKKYYTKKKIFSLLLLGKNFNFNE